jgi:hypothetical protein
MMISMPEFVIVYDSSTGQTLELEEYQDHDRGYARFRELREKYSPRPKVQLNILVAEDRAQVEAYVKKWFL